MSEGAHPRDAHVPPTIPSKPAEQTVKSLPFIARGKGSGRISIFVQTSPEQHAKAQCLSSLLLLFCPLTVPPRHLARERDGYEPARAGSRGSDQAGFRGAHADEHEPLGTHSSERAPLPCPHLLSPLR